MKVQYPILLPDLDIHTEGYSIPDAIFMAEDAISLVGITMQDEGMSVPVPSTVAPSCAPGEILAYAEVDFDAYRRDHGWSVVREE